MSTFKKGKMVILPTNQQTKYLMVYSDVEKTKGKLILNGLKNDEYKEYQHLYIISDDEIKEGDYYIIDDIPELLKNNGLKFIDDYCKKVIATTDTSLYTHQKETVSLPERVFYLPQPSQQFIEKYIEEYNKGNMITDVLVEYELKITHDGRINNNTKMWEELKINPKDNTITIKKIKDNYSREEVDRMLDEQASRTTAEMMEKFKDYKSREEIKSLLFKFTNHFDLKRNIEITLDMQSKWLEENL